jgi:hypothetical protein
MSFTDLEIVQRLLPNSVLIKLNALIDWEALYPVGTTNISFITAVYQNAFNRHYIFHHQSIQLITNLRNFNLWLLPPPKPNNYTSPILAVLPIHQG